MFGTIPSSAETPNHEEASIVHEMEYYAMPQLSGTVSIELQDDPVPTDTTVNDTGINMPADATAEAVRVDPPDAPPPDPDRHDGFDEPNYDLFEDKVAVCETDGNWQAIYKYGTTIISIYRGGLQIWTPKVWEYYGGLEFAPTPDQATIAQQIWIGELIVRDQGPGAWPDCAKGLRFNLRPLRPYEVPIVP